MNTAELDAFFARAADVLTDWEPGDDAMVARVPEADSDELAPQGDSYYSQRIALRQDVLWRLPPGAGSVAFRPVIDVQPFIRAMEHVAAQFAQLQQATARSGEAIAQMRQGLERARLRDARPAQPVSESPAARALRLRQNRNTGPRSRVGLDGHYRRTTA